MSAARDRFTDPERGKDPDMRAVFWLYVLVIVAGIFVSAVVAARGV